MIKKGCLTIICLMALVLGSGTTRAAGAIESPVPVRTVAPEYPEAMKGAGISGLVHVSCLVDEKGNVQEPRVEKSSNDAFSQPALEAVSRWKFRPGRRDGNVAALRITVPIKFSTSDNAAP